MKKVTFLIALIFISIPFTLNAQENKENLKVVKDTVAVDSTEYELTILDPGFDTWLITKPINMYSESYYESKNRMYVAEWNSRHLSAGRDAGLYETYIDYRPEIHYGLEFNYRLYYYFKYFEEVNRISLLPGENGR